MSPAPFIPNRVIRVTSCQGCPFAHLEAEASAEHYCAIGKCLPTVTEHVADGSRPDDCPLSRGDYRVTVNS